MRRQKLNKVKADAVMEFANTIRGAYLSNFIDNHPTVYDVYRSAQHHVKDFYGVETPAWDDATAKTSRETAQGWVICSIKNGDGDMPYDKADYYLVQLGDDDGFVDEPYIDYIDTCAETGFTWFANDESRMAKAYLPIFLPKHQ